MLLSAAAATPWNAGDRRARHDLLGRGPVIDRLDELLERAVAGLSSAAELSGPAGSGRSTALDLVATAAAARGLHVIALRGSSGRPEPAGAALADLVGPLLHLSPALAPAHADALGRLAVGGGLSPAQALPAATAILALLARAAEQRPVVILVDDGDRLDRASLDVLHLVGRRVLVEPVLLLLAGDELRAPAEFARIVLRPLEEDEVVALLARRHPRLCAAVAHQIARAGAGRPRDVLAIADGLTDAQARGRSPLPPRLTSRPRRAEVAALMAGLTAERRSLWATLAASTPGPRDATALARWLWAVDGAALEDAAARGLLTDDAHGLRFATELDGCAVYGACSPSERLLAHRRLADLYRCERARLWQRAQTAPSGSPLLAARLEREALAALAGGAVDDAERLVAHALLVDPGTAGERRHRRTLLHARCLDAAGRPRAALAVLDAGPPRTTLSGAPPTGDFGTRELRARCAVRATNAQVGGLQLAELLAVSCGPRRTRVAREARLADALAGGSAATAAAAGDPVGPAEIAAAAACLAADDPGEAAALLDRLPSATGLRRDEPLRLLAEVIGARIAHDQRLALERLAAAERAAVEQPVVAAHVALVRSEVRSIAGPLTAVAADDQLEARLRDHGLHGLQWRRLWVQGRLALLAGDAAAALQALGSAVEAREASGTGVPPALALDRAEAAARAKSGPGSAPAIPGLLATPGGVAPVRWQAAQVALLRAVEADAVEAAVAPLMDATATTWVWRDGFVLLSAGLRLRRARRRRAAAAVLAGAEAILLATGATPWAERAGEALAVVDGRRGATTTPLTAAELRAAELAASGLRNREIADRLAVAEKTVEQRLTIVYRKLDVRSRVELRARLDPQGDITTARS